MKPLSISELTAQLKTSVESQFSSICARGEAGRVTYHPSGHCYFSLKDADATIDAVIFRSSLAKVKFRIETGAALVVFGAISVYPPQGRYQIVCQSVEPEGAGALALAYEQLKKTLAERGWFDESLKKPLPRYPRLVALVTASTGAALQDMRRVAKKRWNLAKLICVNTLVQGEAAAESIARSIAAADKLGADAIVIARGGGSMEDLWAFNSEIVARAVFEAKTPTISAIGHEIDYVITDFVADKRAPTPSAAMEILLPDSDNEKMAIAENLDNLNAKLAAILSKKTSELNHLKTLLNQLSPLAKIERNKLEVKSLKNQLDQFYKIYLRGERSKIDHLVSQIAMIENAKKLPPKTAQIIYENTAIAVGDLKPKKEFKITDGKHIAIAEAISIQKL
ncbi:MAG: exodeoxyribonuclease VII large subunit [Helicobacteraceae bacterium]|jgi:exodeoxyribonuclease VII large subunit|nr:exodeoxyribonuclease VII large subunit [Helicobacteraceae bacterium]